MAQVTITINSREYAIACEDGQEARIYQLANVLDEKAKAITGGNTQINENMLLAMLALVLADELSEEKKSKKDDSVDKLSKVDNQRILELDEKIADGIKKLDEKLILLANELNIL